MIPRFFKERPVVAAALCLAVLVLTTAFYASPAFEQAAETPTVQVAQSDNFVPLQPLPQPTGSTDSDSFSGFLQTVFQLSIIGAGVLAVLMITMAGFEYMGSDQFTKKQQAKSRLWNAIIGLLIVLGSVLILQTINPNIVGLDIFSERQEEAQEDGGGNITDEETQNENEQSGPSDNRSDYDSFGEFYAANQNAAGQWCSSEQGGTISDPPGSNRLNAECNIPQPEEETETVTQWCYRLVEQTAGPGEGLGERSCSSDQSTCQEEREAESQETTDCEEQEFVQ